MVSSILPKNERKQFDLSSKVECFRSFFGRIEETINCFRDLLTFTRRNIVVLTSELNIIMFLSFSELSQILLQ